MAPATPTVSPFANSRWSATPTRRSRRRPVQSFGALRLVDHAEGVQAQRSAGHASPEPVECPCCGKTFLRSAVIADELPQFWREHGQHGIFHRLYCDHCDKLICWVQASNASGGRLGEVLGEPGIITDRELIEAFLSGFPEAAGVLQR